MLLLDLAWFDKTLEEICIKNFCAAPRMSRKLSLPMSNLLGVPSAPQTSRSEDSSNEQAQTVGAGLVGESVTVQPSGRKLDMRPKQDLTTIHEGSDKMDAGMRFRLIGTFHKIICQILIKNCFVIRGM